MLSALPSPALPIMGHYLCSGLGEGDLKNPSQAVTGAPGFSLGAISHSIPARATLIHRCHDPRVTSCCLAPAPPQNNIGFWIPLVTLDFIPGSTHRDPRVASESHGAKLPPG